MGTSTTQAPPRDVIDLLCQQHGQIRDLFARVEGGTGDERRDAFRELVRLLAVHETAEEEIVHPVARQRLDGGDGIADDRLEEERSAKELLAELDGMDTEDPQFLPKLDRLRIEVLTHARAEERYEFERLRGQFGQKELTTLMKAVQAAEATAPTRPHPGVETAGKNLAVGPLAALMDRVRDLVRQIKG
ncbi:hemerythrin [Actinomadura rubrobrunea]|uniref:Hemerythrin n=1 Tax=Actinomadura rubrobrunea TaxID=115335 RepID=A0A9W6Q113_9ACTN|nr:hemerythrin domain-containing protein [Actinomadura rubrobrunea]GLW66806.1 hemerythrin [Actinomadura rubrobrunea]